MEMIKNIFDLLPGVFNQDAAEGIDAVLQYRLSGASGADYYVIIKTGMCDVCEGLHVSPTVTVNMDAADYADMVLGKITPTTAFMKGKLKVNGDMKPLMRFEKIFDLPSLRSQLRS
jgi:putative sterol carrier protein